MIINPDAGTLEALWESTRATWSTDRPVNMVVHWTPPGATVRHAGDVVGHGSLWAVRDPDTGILHEDIVTADIWAATTALVTPAAPATVKRRPDDEKF